MTATRNVRVTRLNDPTFEPRSSPGLARAQTAEATVARTAMVPSAAAHRWYGHDLVAA